MTKASKPSLPRQSKQLEKYDHHVAIVCDTTRELVSRWGMSCISSKSAAAHRSLCSLCLRLHLGAASNAFAAGFSNGKRVP